MPKNVPRPTIFHLHKLEIMLEAAQGLEITEKLQLSRPRSQMTLDDCFNSSAPTQSIVTKIQIILDIRNNVCRTHLNLHLGSDSFFAKFVLKGLQQQWKPDASRRGREGRPLRTVFVIFWARFPCCLCPQSPQSQRLNVYFTF